MDQQKVNDSKHNSQLSIHKYKKILKHHLLIQQEHKNIDIKQREKNSSK